MLRRGMGDGFSNLFNFGSGGSGSSGFNFDFGGGYDSSSGLDYSPPDITFSDPITYSGGLDYSPPTLNYDFGDLTPTPRPLSSGGGSSDFNFTQVLHDLTGAATQIVPLFTQHGPRPGSYQAVQQQAQQQQEQQQQQQDQGGDTAPAVSSGDRKSVV